MRRRFVWTGLMVAALVLLLGIVSKPAAMQTATAAAGEALQRAGNTLLTSIVTAVQLIDDAIHTEGTTYSASDKGIPPLLRRCDTITVGSATDGEYAIPCVDDDGAIVMAAILRTRGGVDIEFTSDAEHDVASVSDGPQGMANAVAFGANPTAVSAAGDAVKTNATRQGVPFMLNAAPGIISKSFQVQDADGAQSDAALVTVSAGTKIVVTYAKATCSSDTTGNTDVAIGFGASAVPTQAHTGVVGMILAQDGIPPGGGSSEMQGAVAGADGEDVRLTMEDPVGGSCTVTIKYFTIES